MLHVNKMALRAVTSGLAAHLQLFFSPVGDHDASILTELLQATYRDGLEDIWVTYKGNWVDFTAMGNIKENERIDYLTVGTRRDNEASENCVVVWRTRKSPTLFRWHTVCTSMFISLRCVLNLNEMIHGVFY